MAVLQSIRVKFGVVISIIIALALLSFIIDPGTLQTAVQSMSSKYDVGKIDGKSISYTDFQEYVEKYTTLNEIMTGSSAQNEQTNQQIRNAAWQELLDKYMFIKNANAAGINVGQDELVALTVGANVSPVVANNPYFMDESGAFSVQRVREFVAAASTDPTVKLYWDYLQQTILTQQYYAKYGALFTNTTVDNDLTLACNVAENNTSVDLDMVTVNYSFLRDTTINVSKSEIKKFYNAHKEDYRQVASRDIEYVVYEVVPSAEDIEATNDKMSEVYDEFYTTDNMKSFLLRNSDRAYSERWYKFGDLIPVSADVNDFVFGSKASRSGIIKKDNSFYAARVMASANVPDSVYVAHILLQGANAKHVADSLVKVARPSNFSQLALEYSADKNNTADGAFGNIGWMTQSYMIPGFESVITAPTGKPFVINTQYGSHVVLVTKTTKPVAKKQVAILEKTALASKATFNNYYNQAHNFAAIANGNIDGYKTALDSLGVYSHKMNRVLESTATYGSVDQAKEITRWVFDAKAGKVSNVITVNNNFFFVVAVNTVRKEGYTPINEVASTIQNRLYTEKRNEKKCAEVAQKIEGLNTLEEMAIALGTSVGQKQDVTFSNMGSSVEPAVLGAAYGAEVGTVVGPVMGNSGVYLLKVTDRKVGEFYTEADAHAFAAQKAQYNSNMVIPTMAEKAEVKDNRARFY